MLWYVRMLLEPLTYAQESHRALGFWGKPILQRASWFCQFTGPSCIGNYSSSSGYYEFPFIIRLSKHSSDISHNGNGKLRIGPGKVQGEHKHLEQVTLVQLCSSHLCPHRASLWPPEQGGRWLGLICTWVSSLQLCYMDFCCILATLKVTLMESSKGKSHQWVEAASSEVGYLLCIEGEMAWDCDLQW